MNNKPAPNKDDINAAEQCLRDTMRITGIDPDNMTGKQYRNEIRDALASDGFNVDCLTDAVIDAACDFVRG